MNKLPTRKNIRLKEYGYSHGGHYFITICTKNHMNILWDFPPVGMRIAHPQLSSIGELVYNAINNMPNIYKNIGIDKYVIMPNHVHIILIVEQDGGGRAMRVPTVSTVINQMKGYVRKSAGFPVWQARFYDHIIRNEASYRQIWQYIDENPLRWEEDCYYINPKKELSPMKLKFDFNNMMASALGKYMPNQGISLTDIDGISIKIENAKAAMVAKRHEMAWRDLPYNQAEIVKDITAYVNEVKGNFDAFVVLGIGGSALGPLAVQQALNHPYYNELPREKRGGFPKLYVADNVDPERLVCLFQTIEPTKCLFNVVSKSGSTSETMSQFMIIKELLEGKLGKEQAKKHIVCTTDAASGNLIKIAQEEGYKTYIIPNGVGGRFSQLCPVGLLPAAFCGIDIAGLLEGAAFMDEQCQANDIYKNPAYMYAILNYLGMEQGKNISVMMPYADSLKFISDWYAQLWAESLGKRFDNNGNEVFVGPTPVKALGVTDQHSQVQLYTEGPFDKMIVIIGVDKFKETVTIPKIYQDIPSLGFLGGITQNELLKAEQMATEFALLKSGKMNMTITLPAVNAHTIGQLLYMFEVATAFAGELMNINAFDQPGVEEGKNATYAYFGRPGYEDKKKELDAIPAKDARFII